MSDDLKPCPFCGAAAKVSHLDFQNGTTDARMITCSSKNDCAILETRPACIWNSRPLEDALRARIAALEKCVRAAGALIERYGAPASLHAEGTEYHALRSDYDAARAEIDK